jgi:hypothetical protein
MAGLSGASHREIGAGPHRLVVRAFYIDPTIGLRDPGNRRHWSRRTALGGGLEARQPLAGLANADLREGGRRDQGGCSAHTYG